MINLITMLLIKRAPASALGTEFVWSATGTFIWAADGLRICTKRLGLIFLYEKTLLGGCLYLSVCWATIIEPDQWFVRRLDSDHIDQ